MFNRYEKICELLHIQIGEGFKIDNREGHYRFTADGLEREWQHRPPYIEGEQKAWWRVINDQIANSIIIDLIVGISNVVEEDKKKDE